MAKSKNDSYPKPLIDLMARKTAVLSKAREPSGHWQWAETAMYAVGVRGPSFEEQIAPLLETLDRDQEAAVHRISAASCYQHAGQFSRAANLYQAALAVRFATTRAGTCGECWRIA